MTPIDGHFGIDLYWLPLGAGGNFVRLNGRIYEAIKARLDRRPVCDLYHSALQVFVPEGRYVIENTPVIDERGRERGVVIEGPIGAKLGRALSNFSLRTASLARGCHCRHRRSGRQSTSTERRFARRSTTPRTGATGAGACVGPRRDWSRRNVEFELDGFLVDRAHRTRYRFDRGTRRRTCPGLERRRSCSVERIGSSSSATNGARSRISVRRRITCRRSRRSLGSSDLTSTWIDTHIRLLITAECL